MCFMITLNSALCAHLKLFSKSDRSKNISYKTKNVFLYNLQAWHRIGLSIGCSIYNMYDYVCYCVNKRYVRMIDVGTDDFYFYFSAPYLIRSIS